MLKKLSKDWRDSIGGKALALQVASSSLIPDTAYGSPLFPELPFPQHCQE